MRSRAAFPSWPLVLILLAWPRPAGASGQEPPILHVRTGAGCQDTLVETAALRSPTFRSVLHRLEGTNVIVFLRCVSLDLAEQGGRLRFIGSSERWRYVLIEVGTALQWDQRVATLAHELQHAVEVAEAPWVRSREAMAEHYREIGFVTRGEPLTFDTTAARRIGMRVHREVAGLDHLVSPTGGGR